MSKSVANNASIPSDKAALELLITRKREVF
jgi:hypothetical protein